MDTKNQWWGYLHTSGTIQVKRYFGKMDIAEAIESPFCAEVFMPFEADGRDEAIKIITERINKQLNK